MKNGKTKQIEIEHRALLSKEDYEHLANLLAENADDLGEDDKVVYFFLFPDKLLKVVNGISKKNAKISLKLQKIGKGSDFEELEVPIDQNDFKKAVRIFELLEISSEIQRSYQKRHNYIYKDIEIALKYSDTWGYHVELEKVVGNKSEQQEAEREIKRIADELNLKLMTDKELEKFTKKIDEGYRAEKYNEPRTLS